MITIYDHLPISTPYICNIPSIKVLSTIAKKKTPTKNTLYNVQHNTGTIQGFRINTVMQKCTNGWDLNNSLLCF